MTETINTRDNQANETQLKVTTHEATKSRTNTTHYQYKQSYKTQTEQMNLTQKGKAQILTNTN